MPANQQEPHNLENALQVVISHLRSEWKESLAEFLVKEVWVKAKVWDILETPVTQSLLWDDSTVPNNQDKITSTSSNPTEQDEQIDVLEQDVTRLLNICLDPQSPVSFQLWGKVNFWNEGGSSYLPFSLIKWRRDFKMQNDSHKNNGGIRDSIWLGRRLWGYDLDLEPLEIRGERVRACVVTNGKDMKKVVAGVMVRVPYHKQFSPDPRWWDMERASSLFDYGIACDEWWDTMNDEDSKLIRDTFTSVDREWLWWHWHQILRGILKRINPEAAEFTKTCEEYIPKKSR